MNMYSNFCKLQDAAFAINGVCEYLYGVEYKADEVDKIYQQLKDLQKRVQAYASGARLEVTAQERGGFAKQMAVDALQELIEDVDRHNGDDILPILNDCLEKLK
mgnify:FL=1